MPKIIIKKEDLPAINAKEKSYFVRYRIISEDRNRLSYWSPIFKIPIDFNYTSQELSAAYSSGVVTTVWNQIDNLKQYDIWVRWQPNDWTYYGRVSSTFLTLPKPTGATTFSMRVYRTSEPVGNDSNYEYLKLFEKINLSVV